MSPWWILAATLAQESSSDQKPATVSGIVRNSVTGEPLAHAHVRLQVGFGGSGPDAYGAISGVDGRFLIKSIAPGKYFLVAERRGYQSLADVWFSGLNNSPRVVTLKSGEEVKDIVVTLIPDAVISGRVVDAEGVPVDGVTVEAIHGAPQQPSITDDRGEFRIGGLRAGRYLIKAEPGGGPLPEEIRTDGSVAVNPGATYYPSSVTARSAAAVQVRAGQETSGIEIKLIPARLLHISGTVAFSGKSDPVTVVLDGGRLQRHYPVQQDHKFNVWRVPAGHYQVLAETFDDTSKKLMRSAPVAVNLSSTNIEGIQLTLMPSFELTGRLQFPGKPQDAFMNDARPSVTLRPLGSVQNAEQEEDFDSEGRFKMTDVFPGRYHVLVSGLDKNLYVKSVQLNDADFEAGVVDLSRPPAKPVLTIQMAPGAASISGTVRLHGELAEDFAVALFFDDESGFDLAATASIGEHSQYFFDGLAPGKYKLLAYDPKNSGNAWTLDALALYESVTEKIEVGAGDKISMDLKLLP